MEQTVGLYQKLAQTFSRVPYVKRSRLGSVRIIKWGSKHPLPFEGCPSLNP